MLLLIARCCSPCHCCRCRGRSSGTSDTACLPRRMRKRRTRRWMPRWVRCACCAHWPNAAPAGIASLKLLRSLSSGCRTAGPAAARVCLISVLFCIFPIRIACPLQLRGRCASSPAPASTSHPTLPLFPHHAPPALPAVPDFCNGRQLRDYQLQSLEWNIRNWWGNVNCILGDEVGDICVRLYVGTCIGWSCIGWG